jgi:hypothetical protein
MWKREADSLPATEQSDEPDREVAVVRQRPECLTVAGDDEGETLGEQSLPHISQRE